MPYRLTATHTLVRTGGVWEERPLEEEALPTSVVVAADQVRGAQKGVTWVLRRGYTHDLPDDVAAELKATKFHGALREVAAPQPVVPRITQPVYDVATARNEIATLQSQVAALSAQLEAVLEAVRVPARRSQGAG